MAQATLTGNTSTNREHEFAAVLMDAVQPFIPATTAAAASASTAVASHMHTAAAAPEQRPSAIMVWANTAG